MNLHEQHLEHLYCFFNYRKPKDSTCAMFIIVLLFVVPSKLSEAGDCPPLITWQTIQQRLPWGVVLLRGGGFAMAEATKVGFTPSEFVFALWIATSAENGVDSNTRTRTKLHFADRSF